MADPGYVVTSGMSIFPDEYVTGKHTVWYFGTEIVSVHHDLY